MTLNHQGEVLNRNSDWEDDESDNNLYPTIDLDCEDWSDNFSDSIHQNHWANPLAY